MRFRPKKEIRPAPTRVKIQKHGEGQGRETHRPPGPHSAQNVVSRSSAMDGGERFSREQNRRVAGSPQTLAPFCFLPRLRLHPSERASEAVGVVTGRRSSAVTRLLADRRRSPEGEHAVVEQPRCDALIQEPEPVNPRVDAGEPRVPFPDSDEVRIGDGRPRYVPSCFFSYARVSKIWGFFHFSFNPILIDSYSCGRNSRSKQIESA
jgi:hypothetical protein